MKGVWQGWQSNKTRLEKNRFLLPGFFGFFQMDFEKTRVFSGFFKFFGKKLTKTAKFEKKMKPTAFFIKIHVFFGLEWLKIIKDNKGSG